MNNSIEEFYRHFYPPAIKNKKALKNEQLFNLYEKPKKDSGLNEIRTNREAIQPDCVYQSDVLYMPTDPTTQDKYILTVVDISSKGKLDAEPMKIVNAQAVLKAFKTIFSRGILSMPKYVITLDKGSEFNNETIKKYFNDNKVFIKYTQTGRSRQIAFAENRNKIIAKSLFMRMVAQEVLTDEPSTHWVSDLPPLITTINNYTDKLPIKKYSDIPNITKNTIILSLKTPVHIQLDKPREAYTGKKLNGHFRATDIRWSVEKYFISNIILSGGQPPLYQVKDIYNNELPIAFTYNQLQVIPNKENEPPKTVIRGKPTQYVVKQIHNKRTYKKKLQYLVEYKGYPNETEWEWTDYNNLKHSKYIKHLINVYNAL